MRLTSAFACLLALGGTYAAPAQTSGTCAAPITLPAQAGMRLAIQSKPAEVDLIGTDQPGLRISCTLEDESRADEVQIRFDRTGDTGQLRIHGGPNNNVHIRIEMPYRMDVKLGIPAGEVRIDKVKGDKNIDAGAGEIVISGFDPQQYRYVHAWVQIGDVNAPAYGADKGGFFRSLERTTPDGLYRLEAHVITGSVRLN
jgi:hypothetical protein